MIYGHSTFNNMARIDFVNCDNISYKKFHETNHQLLNHITLYGLLISALSYTEEEGAFELKGTINQLVNAAVITNESYALANEIFYAKEDNEIDFNEYYANLKSKENYRKYCSYGLDEFIEFCFDYPEFKILLYDFACYSMNIDLTNEDINWYNSSQVKEIIIGKQLQYRPDLRFKKLILLFNELAPQNLDINDMEKIIYRESFLEYTDMNLNTQLEMLVKLKNQLVNFNRNINTLCINNHIIKLQNAILNPSLCPSLEETIEHVVQCLIPGNLNLVFTKKDSCYFNKEDLKADTVQVFLYGNKTNFPCGRDLLVLDFIESRDKKRLLLSRKELIDFLLQFEQEIIFYIEDYAEIQDKYKIILKKRIFFRVDYACIYFHEILAPFISTNRQIYFHYVNDNVTYIFFKGKDNSILFSPQFNENIQYLKSDIQSKYFEYINMYENDIIDNCFYFKANDTICFDNVVQVTSGYYYSKSIESDYETNRIILTDNFVNE